MTNSRRAGVVTDAASSSQRRTDVLPVDALTLALRAAVLGPANAGSAQVVWADRGSQILLDVRSLQAHLAGHLLVVAVDTETTEFGKAPLIVRFVFGDDKDPAALVAVTDDTAHGNPGIAARWGALFRNVIWAAIVRMSVAKAATRGLQPVAITLGDNHLQLVAQPAVSIPDLARAHIDALRRESPAPPPGSPP